MGLDIYVGTLTRYHAREWETVVQREGRLAGLKVTMVREHEDPPDALTDPAEIEPVILEWREQLSASLENYLHAPLDWIEGMDPPYFTDKPTWDCYSALLVWAAHEEHGDPHLPAVAPDDWTTDPAVQRSQAEGVASRYDQLLHGPELWLPAEFDGTFSAADAGDNPLTIGSVMSLEAQLRELNNRTWRADARILEQWRREGAEFGAPLEISARFAFSVFAHLAAMAAHHRLPMRLDY